MAVDGYGTKYDKSRRFSDLPQGRRKLQPFAIAIAIVIDIDCYSWA